MSLPTEKPDLVNRRRRPRLPARDGTLACCWHGHAGEGDDLAVALLNVSELGACLLLSRELALGDEVLVWLAAPGGLRSGAARGWVSWSGSTGDGRFATGVRLMEALDDLLLRELGGP